MRKTAEPEVRLAVVAVGTEATMNSKLLWILLATSSLAFGQVAVTPGPPLTVNQNAVNDGAGGQTDPHASGDWVAYTDNSVYGIRFQNLDLGVPSDRLIPHADGFFDSLSDISGATIIFMRASSGAQGIYEVQIDPLGNPSPAVEISPSAGALRDRSAIGGDTIAFEDRSYGSTSEAPPEIALASASNPSASAYRLTNDAAADQLPAVSPDGNFGRSRPSRRPS